MMESADRMASMQLEVSDGSAIASPTASQIADALARLPGGADSFAILSSGDQAYVQVAGSASEGFALEYRAGSESEHYRASRSMPLNVVRDVFERYARNDPAWRSQVSWEPWDAGSPSHGYRIGVFAMVAIAAAAVLGWWVMAK
jgi:hypothetical protein